MYYIYDVITYSSLHDVIISLYGVIILNVNSCVNGEVLNGFTGHGEEAKFYFGRDVAFIV